MNTEEKNILETLAATQYQSAAQLGKSAGIERFQLTRVIGELVSEGKIASTMVGEVRVYFLAENVPDGSLYNTGDGCFAPRSDAISESETPPPTATPKPPKPGRRPMVAPEKVRELAAQGLTRADAAARLGLTAGTFSNYLYQKRALLNAWRAGENDRSGTTDASAPPDLAIAEISELPEPPAIVEASEPAPAPRAEIVSTAIAHRDDGVGPELEPNVVMFVHGATPLQFTCVDLSNGGAIEIKVAIDLFTASPAETALFNSIVSAVQKYREAAING